MNRNEYTVEDTKHSFEYEEKSLWSLGCGSGRGGSDCKRILRENIEFGTSDMQTEDDEATRQAAKRRKVEVRKLG